MKQSSRLILTVVFFALLIALARYITGQWFYIPSGDQSIWFQSGLLMVVLGSFFIEQHFTKPVDVVANVVAGVVTLLTIEYRENFVFWEVAFLGIIVLGLFAFISMAIQTFSTNEVILKIGRLFYQVAIFFGSAKRLFSVILFLSIISYFQVPSKSSLLILLFWATVVSSEPIGIPNLIDRIIDAFSSQEKFIGKVFRVLGNNIYQIQLQDNVSLKQDSLFEVVYENEKNLCIPLDSIELRDKRLVYAVKIGTRNDNSDVNQEYCIKNQGNVNVVSADKTGVDILAEKEFLERKNIVGVVAENSDIAELKLKILSNLKLAEGHLLKVYIEGKPVIYQVVNAITKSENFSGDEEWYTLAIAQQVGVWEPDNCHFESIGWVASPGSIVFAESNASISLDNVAPDRHIVGNLPNSTYPIHVNVSDIVTHHTAILGITGSGKTYLAYDLIRKMIGSGIKVLIFDISTDYARDLADVPDLQNLTTTTDVPTFLNSVNRLGIAQFQPTSGNTLVKATAISVQAVLQWAKQNLPSQQGEKIEAKVCVVFEEAHSLIPEWNTVSIPGDKDEVNKISQAILQGRKYGVGALVITQRTANITKTILNQCNTIFALQSFDQTGLDFLKNYVGEGHAHALSTLLKRQAVVFGKASSSRRPVIVKLKEKPSPQPTTAIVATEVTESTTLE